jgi:heme-degrading monooxygenase HmoA
MFHILWRFETTEELAPAFTAAYGPDGAWVAFFRKAEGFVATELFQRRSSPPCFLTIDRWETRAAYERFRRDHGAAYAALDAECEGLTRQEAFLAAWED